MERRQVVAVFSDENEARRAADTLRDSGAAADVRVGERSDEQRALRNEMQEEMEHTFAGPGNVGPFTEEMAKGASVGVVVATLFGALAALPFGLLEFGPILWQRLLIAAAVGAVAGATIGFVAGGGLASEAASEPLGAERGVPLAVTVAAGEETERVAQMLVEHQPLRLDVTDLDGRVIDTVHTEGPPLAHEVGRTLGRGHGDWGGGLHEDR